MSDPRWPCLHKQADHQCGTNARARLDGCRCEACLEARLDYDREWKLTQGEFPRAPSRSVDAQPVYEHVRALMDDGMGPKRIAEVSGVPHGAVSKLVYGDYLTGRVRSRRIRRHNADRLLAVELDLADGKPVDGTEARAIVAELLARGWSKAEIGRRIGANQSTALRGGGQMVNAGTLRALRRLMLEPTPLRTHNRTKRTYRPNPDRPRQFVVPSTPGVPVPSSLLLEWDRQRLWQAVGAPLV